MDEMDFEIKKALSEDVQLTDKYKNIIRNTLKEKKHRREFMKTRVVRILGTACACLIFTTSVVFAKDIRNVIKNFFNSNESMDKVISNGYITEPKMEYVDAGETKVKVNNLLMDDYNLNFTLSIQFDKNIDMKNFVKIELAKMIINDNYKNILYCNNQEIFDNYCIKNNLNNVYNEFNENYNNSGINTYIKEINYDENKLNVVCNLSGNNYPKSKNLDIDISQIIVFDNEHNINKSFNGLWNMNIEIPTKFYERNSMLYKVKSCSNKKFSITNVEITDINMKLELSVQEEKIYKNDDTEEIINKKIEEQNEKEIELLKQKVEAKDYDNIGLFYAKPYVENEEGEKFYPTNSNSEDSGCSNDYMTGIIKYWQTFNLTKQDTTNILKVYMKYKGEDVYIELEK